MVMCLGQDADLHMVQLMPLPLTVCCSSKSRLVLPSWFYLSGAGSPGWSRTKSKRAVKWLCAWVRACVCVHACLHACVRARRIFSVITSVVTCVNVHYAIVIKPLGELLHMS